MLTELDELDSSSGWVPLFQKLNWIARENAGSQKIAKLPENRLLNRYRDVLPYDHSRVVLKEGETDYINANLVEVPSVNRRYILTQGPLKTTTAHFWQMVWEQKSEAIIMLNRVIEKNQIKCYQYWPCGERVGHTNVLEFGNFRITYVEENMSDYFTVRTLEVFNIKKEEKRNVYHFHYLHWPDFGVPSSPATFLSFLFEARNAGILSEDVGPSVIHCSAGIGRSGTYVMVDSILKQVEKTQDLNGVDIKKNLLEMRHYRVGLIQTPDQLRFTYAAILEGTHMLMPNVYDETLDKFLQGRDENEEEEEEDDVPPPVPARKRQDVDQTVDKEANIAPKRKRSLPDIPPDSTSSVPESPKERMVEAAHDTSKGISTFQADNISSDESDGEDEIIDLSASSSSSLLTGEESQEDSTEMNEKEEPVNKQEDKEIFEKKGLKDSSVCVEKERDLVTEQTIKITEEDRNEMVDKKEPINKQRGKESQEKVKEGKEKKDKDKVSMERKEFPTKETVKIREEGKNKMELKEEPSKEKGKEDFTNIKIEGKEENKKVSKGGAEEILEPTEDAKKTVNFKEVSEQGYAVKYKGRNLVEKQSISVQTDSILLAEEIIESTKDKENMNIKEDKMIITEQSSNLNEQEKISIKELKDESKDHQKPLEENMCLQKVGSKPARPLSEDSGIGGTELDVSSGISPEGMDVDEKDVIESNITPKSVESEFSESMEPGSYVRIIKAEKVTRTKDKVSIESIGGSIGTNPRESNPEFQKVTQNKPADVVTESSARKESETELKRRLRQEKKEKTEKLVNDIKAKVKYEEDTRFIRKVIKNSLIVVAVCSIAYLAYRCYGYFFRAPPPPQRRSRFF